MTPAAIHRTPTHVAIRAFVLAPSALCSRGGEAMDVHKRTKIPLRIVLTRLSSLKTHHDQRMYPITEVACKRRRIEAVAGGVSSQYGLCNIPPSEGWGAGRGNQPNGLNTTRPKERGEQSARIPNINVVQNILSTVEYFCPPAPSRQICRAAFCEGEGSGSRAIPLLREHHAGN